MHYSREMHLVQAEGMHINRKEEPVNVPWRIVLHLRRMTFRIDPTVVTPKAPDQNCNIP